MHFNISISFIYLFVFYGILKSERIYGTPGIIQQWLVLTFKQHHKNTDNKTVNLDSLFAGEESESKGYHYEKQ